MAATVQNAVNWGEISPAFYGRQDLPQYRAGCSTLRNMFVSPRGGAVSRGGTKFCGQSMQTCSVTSTPPELITFTYNADQAYALEFGDFYMRVLDDGAYVTETAQTVSTATNASPGVFTTPTAHGFTADVTWVYLSGFAGMTEVNGHIYVVDTTPTTGSFTLKSTLTGTALDTTAFGTYTASSGTVAAIFTLTTPYAIADVHTLKVTQSANVMSIVHPLYKPHDLERTSATAFTLTTTSFSASIVPPATVTATPSTTAATTVSTRYQYVVTAVDAVTGEESTASIIATVTNSVNIALTLGSNTIAWTAVTGATYYNIYKAPACYAVNPPAGLLFGYMATAYGLSFVDTNVVPDMTITPPLHYNPFATSSIIYFAMTATGSSYTTSLPPPTIVVSDPTGSGAAGYAVVQTDGGVYAIIPTSGGEGYTSTSVAISSTGGGSGATFTATAATGSFWYGAVTVNTSGSSYVSGTQLKATYTLSGVTYTLLSTSATVGGGGGITAASFPDPLVPGPGGGNRPLASTVTITVFSGAGVGATATASIGPSTGTFPSVVAYFGQRRYYANTDNDPDTYWGSQPGAYTNMDRSIPITDSDAIVGTPWSQQVNGIQWMLPMPGGLVLLTGFGAWQLNGGTAGQPVTPADQNAQAQAYSGCSADVTPLVINYDILYVQHEGAIVRDLAYSLVTNIYTGTDITVMSNHLFESFTVDRWDWAEERHKTVWLVRSDGALLSLTYLKEQNVFGWARHDTNGLFESVCCVSELPVNAPYFVVKRYINGTWAYYVERMDNRLWTNIEDAWCLDCALSYPQTEPAATLTASSATGDANVSSYVIGAGGSGYTAPTGVVRDLSGTGSGATVTLSVSGGVIVTAAAVAQGTDYLGPVIVDITDATGTGASITGVITDYVTLSASAGVFVAGDVGDIIRMGGGKLEVVVYNSSTSVTANVISPIVATMPNDPNNMPVPQASGSWTIATPTSTVSGLDHLEGMEVMALADGGVVEATTVVDGSISLPAPASKIVVGLPFTAQMQTLYLETGEPGSIQGQRQVAYEVVLRCEASRPPTIGSNQPDQAVQPNFATIPWTHMADLQDRSPSTAVGQPAQLFTGDYYTNIFSNWDTNAQIAIEQANPVPLTVLALYPNMNVGDTRSRAG